MSLPTAEEPANHSSSAFHPNQCDISGISSRLTSRQLSHRAKSHCARHHAPPKNDTSSLPEAPTVWKKENKETKTTRKWDSSNFCAWGEVTPHQQAGHCKEQFRTKARGIKRDLKENRGMMESVFTGSSPLSCRVSLSLHKTGYLRTWEIVSVMKERWWNRWKPQGAVMGREGGRKEDVTTQGTAHTGITSCSASLNHHYMLIPIPQDIPFHATHHNSIFMSEYIKILCFPFSLGFRIQLSADQSFIF